MEYGDISIKSKYVFFDQFNSLSCREAFRQVASLDCSAVILGTTFVDETRELCDVLDSRGIPYVFLDGKVSDANPVASYLVDQDACGRLMARLMDGLTPEGRKLALLLPRRIGTQMSNNSAVRMEAFKAFFRENNLKRDVLEGYFSIESPEKSHADIRDFLAANPGVGGVAVVISTGYLISDALSGDKREIVIGGFDVTEGNARCVREGGLEFLINQHPERQGFCAVESILHFLLYGAPDKNLREYLPIDIVFRESIAYWHDEI
jgi:LacI family transcriptional regulator